jgi:hypothetical protein
MSLSNDFVMYIFLPENLNKHNTATIKPNKISPASSQKKKKIRKNFLTSITYKILKKKPSFSDIKVLSRENGNMNDAALLPRFLRQSWIL